MGLGLVSVQGFGEKRIGAGLVYPGSGDTGDNRPLQPAPDEKDAVLHAMANGTMAPSDNHKKESNVKHNNSSGHLVEDPSNEFETQKTADSVSQEAPRVVNVGIYGPGGSAFPMTFLWNPSSLRFPVCSRQKVHFSPLMSRAALLNLEFQPSSFFPFLAYAISSSCIP